MIDNIIRSSTCRVSCGDQTGTGHVVAVGRVLTCRHCVLDAIAESTPVELNFGAATFTANVLSHSEEFDSCILEFEPGIEHPSIPISFLLPREGEEWKSFGFPSSRGEIGHRINGRISQVLPAPTMRIDVDLSVDPSAILQEYAGHSGGCVVVDGFSIGMMRLRLDGGVAAISNYQMREFLFSNGIEPDDAADESSQTLGSIIIGRSDFEEEFETILLEHSGEYIFLQGAHGIGKTTFVRTFSPETKKLLHLGSYSLASESGAVSPLYRGQPEIFFDWLANQISDEITKRPARKEERSYATLLVESARLLDGISEYCVAKEVVGVILIDGINEVHDLDLSLFNRLIELLPKRLPKAITIVFSAPSLERMASGLKGRVKAENAVTLPGFSDQASAGFCWHMLAEGKATVSMVEAICQRAKGHPLYLRYLVEYANAQQDATFEEFPIFSGEIETYYDAIWDGLVTESHAVNLLAIIARLRTPLSDEEFLQLLSPEEQAAFIGTIRRISHLLTGSGMIQIYHPSFSSFIATRTAASTKLIHERLAHFCQQRDDLRYSTMNQVHHLLNSRDAIAAIRSCNQEWVDKCVALGAEPDVLIGDIEESLAAAMALGHATETVRVLLQAQRVAFRYNVLFAQSASSIAEALISLGRAPEALQHVIRMDRLIVGPDEALRVAHTFIQSGNPGEAVRILRLLRSRVIEAYSEEQMHLQAFVRITTTHARTLLMLAMADGVSRMGEIEKVFKHAAKILRKVLADQADEDAALMESQVSCVLTGHFICFRDEYPRLDAIRKRFGEIPMGYLQRLVDALIDARVSMDSFDLSKVRTSYAHVFEDINALLDSGDVINGELRHIVVDTLVLCGASSALVTRVATGMELTRPAIVFRAGNGADVDFSGLATCAIQRRSAAFLDESSPVPRARLFTPSDWQATFERILELIMFCDGRARRAKADSNVELLRETFGIIQSRVLEPLRFPLSDRVKWIDSYAIPEEVLPFVYRHTASVLVDCFPRELPVFFDDIIERCSGQLGIYTEGFRQTLFGVIEEVLREETPNAIVERLFALLGRLRDHLLNGVENRHELVPELLRLIPLFARIGASEEAKSLHVCLSSVDGPHLV